MVFDLRRILAIVVYLVLTCIANVQANGVVETVLLDEDFEGSLASWTINPAGSSTVVEYNQGDSPTLDVRNEIGGEVHLLRAGGAQSKLTQVVDLSGRLPGQNLYVGGHVGGVGATSVCYQLRVRYLQSNGVELPVEQNVACASYLQRNLEPVLMRRASVFPIPSLATKARVELVLVSDGSSGGGTAFADNIVVKLVEDTPVPPPLPTDQELLHNPGFESGWAVNSPLDLNDPVGWEGLGENEVQVTEYGAPGEGTPVKIPSLSFRDHIEGGNRFLRNANQGIGSAAEKPCRVHQIIDVRGNAESTMGFDGLVLRVSAYLGGAGPSGAQVLVKFLSGTIPLKSYVLGPVWAKERNFEPVLIKRENSFDIPLGTEFVEITVDFDAEYWGGWGFLADAFADNVSARLTYKQAPEEVKLHKNLVKNGSFDDANAWAGSPLTPNKTSGWDGYSVELSSTVIAYGEFAYAGDLVPSLAFAAKKGLGDHLLAVDDYAPPSKSHAAVHQTIDVSALAEPIGLGAITAKASAWLGLAENGATSGDSAIVLIRAFQENGNPVQGFTTQPIGPVSAIDLANGTGMVKRKIEFDIKPTTARIEVEVQLRNAGGGSKNLALADDIHLELGSSIDLNDLGPATCDSAKVLAFGKYGRSTLLAYADFAKLAPPKQDQAALDKKLGKATLKMSAKFEKAEALAAEVGGTCTYAGDVTDIATSSFVILDQLASDVAVGLDVQNKQDRKLRKTILSLTGALLFDISKAESNNIKMPNSKTLTETRQKALTKFVGQATKKIEEAGEAGVAYTGASTETIVALVLGQVDGVVELLH